MRNFIHDLRQDNLINFVADREEQTAEQQNSKGFALGVKHDMRKRHGVTFLIDSDFVSSFIESNFQITYFTIIAY